MKTEIVTLCEERNVTLTAYLQEVGGEFAGIPRRPAALILREGDIPCARIWRRIRWLFPS